MRILFLIAFSLIVISAPGYAQEANVAGCVGQHKSGGAQGFESLGLTPEQRTKIDELENETQKSIIPVKAEIELKRIDLDKEMKLDKPDRDRVMKMVKDIHALELQMKTAMIDQQFKIHGILTPEQRSQMQKPMYQCMRMDMMEKHMEMRGEGQSHLMKECCPGCKGHCETDKAYERHEKE